MSVPITALPRLDPAPVEAVVALAARAAAADEVAPLNDDARLALSAERPGTVHLLAGDPVLGYAQVEPTALVLVVDPEHRRRGIGAALLAAGLRQGAAGVWAFGDLPAAQALATRTGLVPVRTLLQLGRALAEPITAPEPADDVRLRAFVPGQDEDAWLAVNARAFADHPEQGAMTRADLDARMAEPWFDPAGFLLAVDPGQRVLGFHWTKRHSASTGEVYVLGVDPDAGGHGLGTALLLAGLAHLRAVGCAEVILYVEADHPRAVRLYTGRGFTERSRDVMYAPSTSAPTGESEEN